MNNNRLLEYSAVYGRINDAAGELLVKSQQRSEKSLFLVAQKNCSAPRYILQRCLNQLITLIILIFNIVHSVCIPMFIRIIYDH